MPPNTETGPNGVPEFDTEAQYSDWLVKRLENIGYDAITEVRPHGSRYQADLILLNGPASPIGMELKYFTGGSDAARAHKQIVEQYSGKKYVSRRVTRWAFAPYMPKLQWEQEKSESRFRRGKRETLEHFFIRYGIGYFDIHNLSHAELRWGKGEYRIPMFSLIKPPGERNYNLDLIDDRIADRLY